MDKRAFILFTAISALCYIALSRVLVLVWIMLIRARLYKSLPNGNPHSLSIPLDYTTWMC